MKDLLRKIERILFFSIYPWGRDKCPRCGNKPLPFTRNGYLCSCTSPGGLFLRTQDLVK